MRYKGDDGFNSNSSLLLSNDAAYNGLIRVHLRANNQTLDLEFRGSGICIPTWVLGQAE